jgi:circadian clock protein KaiB
MNEKDKTPSAKESVPVQVVEKEVYVLRLYVAGISPRSKNAIENIRAICVEDLKGQCDLEVIDVSMQPQYTQTEQIIAIPTLIKKLPLPLRRLIGDLSNKEQVLVGLDYVPKKDQQNKPNWRAYLSSFLYG